jgi:hypothetical protein
MAANALRLLADALEAPEDAGRPPVQAAPKQRRRRRATIVAPENVTDIDIARARDAARKAGIR